MSRSKDHKKDHKKDCCCDSTNNYNNNNNNNITVPPVIINNGDVARGRLIDFESFTTTPQDVNVGSSIISNNLNAPTIVAQLTVNDIKSGNRIWLNGLFHVTNQQLFPTVADIRIYVNTIVPTQEIYRAVVEIDRSGTDNFGQIMTVQDVERFNVDISSRTYILVVNLTTTLGILQRPITFTASLIS